MARTIRIGTRRSKLAAAQADFVLSALRRRRPDCEYETVGIATSGDRLSATGAPLPPGKGFFTREIEQALIDGRIDVAVHSMKDLPTEMPPGLVIVAVPKRSRPNDALVSRYGHALAALKSGALIGTGSPRRAAQILAARPDVKITDIRGNVDTRLRKLDGGQYDAVVLAFAGLERLGLTKRISEVFSLDAMVPAVGQGALAVEVRADDERAREIVAAMNDEMTALCVAAERNLLRALGGGCANPIAAVAAQEGAESICLRALVASPDGKIILRTRQCGRKEDAEKIGLQAAEELIAQGASELLDKKR